MLVGVKRQQAHEMQGLRMIGIHGKSFPAAKLGVEVPLGAHMGETRGMEPIS